MAEKVLENIAVLLLEVIGFIASPIYLGAILLFMFEVDASFFEIIQSINGIVLVLGIYVIGYLIRAISLFVGSMVLFDIKKEIEKDLSENFEIYKLVKADISQKIKIPKEKLEFRDLRNIELSKRPPIADKAYLFMFRSNLFFDIFIVNAVCATFVLVCQLLNLLIISLEISEISIKYFPAIIVVIITILLWKPLLKARKYFFKISYSIPLTNYIAHEKL